LLGCGQFSQVKTTNGWSKVQTAATATWARSSLAVAPPDTWRERAFVVSLEF
jgi:hypothetical protein